MTYEERMLLHKATQTINALDPHNEDDNACTYIMQLEDAIRNFYKNRLADWQFDIWAGRYID